MKCTVKAPSNIAFIKYWGKTDDILRLPANASFSMNLSQAVTITTVESSAEYAEDSVSMENGTLSDTETARMLQHVDCLRKIVGCADRVKIRTKNTFPKGTGIASSASGFAALTVAASRALGLKLSEKELTVLARLGSGSACRSIPDGFVVWEKGLPAGRQGISSETSFAHSIAPSTYWDIRDIVCVVDASEKKVPTSEGHISVATSPLWESRMKEVPIRMECMLDAFRRKDFPEFGACVEADALSMHRVMQTQTPPLMYWTQGTKCLMERVRSWRSEGIPVFFTIDAGANVHIICQDADEARIIRLIRSVREVQSFLVNAPAMGAREISDHLF
jgi:diphosphomevalonate decarboxylase